MSSNEIQPEDKPQLKSRQVSPLPIGPGGNDPTKREMNETNTQLTMLTAQANANTKYDPPVPEPVTKPVTIEGFCSGPGYTSLITIAGLLIVYGLVAK
jgi:hypothetical protein